MFEAYKIPRPIVTHRDILSDRFMFNFQMMVVGKMASDRSVNELTARKC